MPAGQGASPGSIVRPRIGLRRAACVRLWVGAGLLVAAAVACVPVDGPVSAAARDFATHTLGGDVRRELHALQQYGQGAITLLVAWAVWLSDPGRRRRLLDLLAAAVVAGVVAFGAKMLIGRPRPKFDDPSHVLGPFGAYPLGPEVGVRHAWEVGSGISSDLWSMPSSHTVFAVVLSAWLAVVYPRLRPLAVAMAVLVGLSRVLFGAHYLSDVLVGGAVGLAGAVPAVSGYWGVRALDGLWVRWVDRSASPALPAVLAREASGR